MQDCCPIYYELADPGVESLLAAVGLDVVDDGPVQGGGAAHPPRAHQHHMHTHLVIIIFHHKMQQFHWLC